MRILAITAALLLTGCAARYTWQHPGLEPTSSDRQRDIDSAQCTAIAMQSIPLPSPPPTQAASAAPSDYSISGTTTSYGPNGEVSTGQYSGTTMASSGGSGLSAGAAFVRALEDQEDHTAAVKARGKLAEACMLERGWVKARTEQ